MPPLDQKTSRFSFGRITRAAVTLALVVVLAFGAGMVAGAQGGTRILADTLPLLSDGLDATPDSTVDLTDFWKVWNTLDSKFVESHATSTLPDSKEKLWGAIQGLTDSYGDPYTVFLPPQEAKIFREDILGNFSGVGIEMGVNREGLLTVIAPLKGTPAERAGMHAGDVILAIDGTSTDGMSTDEAVKLIRGEKGTPVVFKIYRDKKISEITVVRDTIQVPTIDKSYDPTSGVYTITLYSFTGTANKLFSDALSDFKQSGSDKLLIDLRGNPGGYLQAAVQIASRFLPKGDVVVTEDYDGKRENLVHRSSGGSGVAPDTKVAILMDQGSASASEILAGALKDHGAATLIGTRSFGKGSVQELVEVGGGSLKITVARWLTPSGVSISDGGLQPDIKVERTQEDREKGRDPQRDRAIEFLTKGK